MTDAIDQHPHCVLLLDEIEKAHPELYNILLQVMDHGKLTDHSGKQIDFRNVILIMTTNAGAADMAKAAFGFTQNKRVGEDTTAINKLFTPEFRNRLDAIVSFGHLPQEVIVKVVDKFIMQLEAQLADRNVTIELTDEARKWLVENGYDEQMGARPMARVIQSAIKTPLADEVLFGRLKNGGTVRVMVITNDEGERKLGFVYPEGPVLPRPERDIVEASKKRVRSEPEVRRAKARKLKDGDEPEDDDLDPTDEQDMSETVAETGEVEPGRAAEARARRAEFSVEELNFSASPEKKKGAPDGRLFSFDFMPFSGWPENHRPTR